MKLETTANDAIAGLAIDAKVTEIAKRYGLDDEVMS